MSINLYEIQNPKRCFIGSDQELINKIVIALNGLPLDTEFNRPNDDGSLDDLMETSKFRKLRWTVRKGVKYALVYAYPDEKEFFDKFRSKYGNEIRWTQRTRKMTIDERVITYSPSEYVEYKERTSIDELNFFILPAHVWNDAIREEIKNLEVKDEN